MRWFQCSCTFLRKGGKKKRKQGKKKEEKETSSTYKAFSINRIISALDIQFHLLSNRKRSKTLHNNSVHLGLWQKSSLKSAQRYTAFYKAHSYFHMKKKTSLSSTNFTFATATRTSCMAGRNIFKEALTFHPQRVIKRR